MANYGSIGAKKIEEGDDETKKKRKVSNEP